MSASGQETDPNAGNLPIQVTVFGKAKLGKGNAMAEFEVELGYQEERLHASCRSEKGLGLQDLLPVFAPQVELPDLLRNGPRIKAFHIAYQGREASKAFEIGLSTELVLATDLKLQLVLEASSTSKATTQTQPAKQEMRFGGKLQVAGHLFAAGFEREADRWRVYARYAHVAGAPATARDVVSAFLPENLKASPPMQAVLGFLGEIQLLKAAIGFERMREQAETTTIFGMLKVGIGEAGTEVELAFMRSTTTNGDAASDRSDFAVRILSKLTLEQLPMVGEKLQEIGLGLEDIGLSYSTFAQKVDFPDIQGLFEEAEELLEPQANHFEPGLQFLGRLTLPEIIGEDIEIGFEGEAAESPSEIPQPSPASLVPANALNPSPVKWFDVNKTLGPVTVGKVGMRYADGNIGILLTAGFKLGGIEIALEGLGLAITLQDLFAWNFKSVKPSLDGLGISFKRGGLEISGMLVKVARYEEREVQEPVLIDGKDTGATRLVKRRVEVLEFTGGVQVKIKPFAIAGLGSYTTVPVPGSDARAPSFFVYAAYHGPIGGPAFFFVTGVALGFGFNRRLRLPTIAEVPTFPLVSIVMGAPKEGGLFAVVQELIAKDWIPASPGDYWLAIGIRFSSFKIIDTFVLVTVQFGSALEFGMIGLSRIAWPDAQNPVISIELAIAARFAPATGLIQVDGLLTNSYIFDKNCKLNGGFAFYAWVSGEHEGDFVVSLGGYHPKFPVPAHYPKVDRLALSWRLGKSVSIYGDMYFALTPRAIMAGGKWEVTYDIGFLRASVLIWANVLIGWAPFYYEIDGGVLVRIEASIKIGWFRANYRLQLGAQVRIWGPPFAGEIFVDWTIFSFTIPFGEGQKKPPLPLNWQQFGEQFVPKEKVVHVKAAAGVLGSYTPAERQVRRASSKRASAAASKPDVAEVLIVNPNDFVLFADSFFPLTELNHGAGKTFTQPAAGGTGRPELAQVASAGSARSLFIKPMSGAEGKQLVTKPKLTVRSGGREVKGWNVWYATKGAPDALWGPPGALEPADSHGAVLEDLVSGIFARPPQAPAANMEQWNVETQKLTKSSLPLVQAQPSMDFEVKRVVPSDFATLQARFPGWKFPVAKP